MNATTTTTASTSTSAAAAASKGAKRVAKKPGAAAAAPATAIIEEPVAAAAPVAVAAPVAAPAAAADAFPEASEAGAGAAATQKKFTSVEEEIAAAMKQLTAIRDGAMEALAVFKRLAKAHTREVKDARKRKRAKKEETEGGATAAPAADDRPCIFTTPVVIANSLCTLLGKPNGSKMMPTEVTRAINTYVDENGLKAEEKNMVRPNEDMIAALGIPATDLANGALPRRMLQKYLYKLYTKDSAVAAPATA